MNISIWSIGKANEPHLAPGIEHYLKKLAAYQPCALDIFALPRKEQSSDVRKTIDAEGRMVLGRLRPRHTLILLDERGKQHTSEGWAHNLQALMNSGTREAVFLIGGAHGVSDAVRQKAHAMWSLGLMVMPHQLVRLVLAEQLYRASSILAGSPYHHA